MQCYLDKAGHWVPKKVTHCSDDIMISCDLDDSAWVGCDRVPARDVIGPSCTCVAEFALGVVFIECHRDSSTKKKESCRRRTAVGSERERPEESEAGEGRLDLKRGKLPSRDNLLGGKSRDFLLLYCYSSRMSIGQVVPNFTY
jgi:hypothetical protein